MLGFKLVGKVSVRTDQQMKKYLVDIKEEKCMRIMNFDDIM